MHLPGRGTVDVIVTVPWNSRLSLSHVLLLVLWPFFFFSASRSYDSLGCAEIDESRLRFNNGGIFLDGV